MRIMPCCLCEGEAAGIAAAMTAKQETVNIHNVNTDKLREIHKANDAYLPDKE